MRWLVLLVGLVSGAAAAQPGLSRFENDAALKRYLRGLAAAQDATPAPVVLAPAPPVPTVPSFAAPAPAPDDASDIVVTGARAEDGITNNQVVGVDEGGIVKLAGETLVILRRGRLFTVSLANGGMRPVASIDAFPPGVDGRRSWYDEMLLLGDRVVVVGYSYARGGTEVNRFRLGRDGTLRFEDATHLRSNDYYSSRNYASRLIGSTLVYYTSLDLDLDRPLAETLPALRQWRGGGAAGDWRRTASAQQVFIPARLRAARRSRVDTLHSVTRCDLAAPVLDCASTVVLGPEGRSFFVSADAVYVWTGAAFRNEGPGFVYRLPLSVGVPQAVGVSGMPIDQFSFNADAARGSLNVMVRAGGGGDAMGAPEAPGGSLALARIPMRAFGSGAQDLPRSAYQPLPTMKGWSVQNRWVGDHLLYAGAAPAATVVGAADRRITNVPLPHGVSRVDRMGNDAVLIGEGEEALGFSAVGLDDRPRHIDTFLLPAAAEGEVRSHAFFFRADTPDGASGLLGLPVARERHEGTRFLGNAAAMQFLQRRDRRLAPVGGLEAQGSDAEENDDDCVASCTDWYGNARPIF